MPSDDASLVFMRAFLLAQRPKAPEIRVDHPFAPLDEDMPSMVESSIRPEPLYFHDVGNELQICANWSAAVSPLYFCV